MGILLWGHPQTDAQQFILSSLLAFVTGAFTNAVMSAGRVADALREKENYRREAQRVARAKTALEEKYFAWRLSSGSTDDRKKGGR